MTVLDEIREIVFDVACYAEDCEHYIRQHGTEHALGHMRGYAKVLVGLDALLRREDERIDRIVGPVETVLDAASLPPSVAQARAFLPRLRTAVRDVPLASDVPTFCASFAIDDGCCSIEWRFPDRRLAFIFEADGTSSGHIVAKAGAEMPCESALTGNITDFWIRWALFTIGGVR